MFIKWLLNGASIVESIKANNHNWCPSMWQSFAMLLIDSLDDCFE